MHTTILDLQKMKLRGERIPMVTAYDYTSAQIVDRAGIPIILVGDSLGMVVLGHTSTIPVTLEEILHHTRAVVRGSQSALIVGDLPFLTYTTVEQAVHSAGRLLQEGGAHAVKLEGGRAVADVVRRLVEVGIPVMGHLGLTPQSVHQLGGFGPVGKTEEEAARILEDARALQQAGSFAVVLESIPAELARRITTELTIPTIGIGAGPDCDGQVLVSYDAFGLFDRFVPRFVKRYANLGEMIVKGAQEYIDDVQRGSFPGEEHSTRSDDVVKGRA